MNCSLLRRVRHLVVAGNAAFRQVAHIMTEAEFWNVVDDSYAATPEEVVDNLRGMLEAMPQADVVAFQRSLNAMMARAYSWDLIAAACFLGCGQSDDGFEDFRAWLIAQGRETFEAVLKDVNRLADIPFHESPTEEWYCEEFHYLPGEIGRQGDDPNWPHRREPDVPHGRELTLTKEELRRRFPKLWDRFGDRFMIGIPNG